MDILWLTAFEVVKYIFVLLNLILLAVIIYTSVKAWEFRPKLSPYREPEREVLTLGEAIYKEKWGEIKEKFDAASPEFVKLAIIEADKLADQLLKSLGIEGEHIADRLEKLSPEDVKSLERLWAAHRLRNEIVHTPEFEVSPAEAAKTIESYEAFLKEMGAL